VLQEDLGRLEKEGRNWVQQFVYINLPRTLRGKLQGVTVTVYHSLLEMQYFPVQNSENNHKKEQFHAIHPYTLLFKTSLALRACVLNIV